MAFLKEDPAKFAELSNRLLRETVFPDGWKIARLVLLPKPGEPPENRGSYLENRRIVSSEGETFIMSAGVPQGSFLVPAPVPIGHSWQSFRIDCLQTTRRGARRARSALGYPVWVQSRPVDRRRRSRGYRKGRGGTRENMADEKALFAHPDGCTQRLQLNAMAGCRGGPGESRRSRGSSAVRA